MKAREPLIIILGEPNSVFIEILSKVLIKFKKNINYPIILIGSKNIIFSQLKILKKKLSLELLNKNFIKKNKLKNKLYLIDIEYNFKKPFEKISNKSKSYISACFKEGLKLIDNNISKILINGPVSKKHFLPKKFPGVTEYIFDKSKNNVSKKPVMLLFNKKFSVSPLTTHIPLKKVNKNIQVKNIVNHVAEINKFYIKKFKIKPRIAVLGLNPHCESKSILNEENLFISPAINKLKKKKLNINGPYPADTFFIKDNIKKFDTIVGMYHDQVLTPFKTIFEFDACNITLGLPFLRISVDHGPNNSMIGKNRSNTDSLENIFNLIRSIK